MNKKTSILLTWLAVVLAAAIPAAPAAAQDGATQLPLETLSLDDLSAFRSPDSNWRIAGRVAADRRRDRDLRTAPGTGVLVNVPSRRQDANLFTDWEHGDLELELDFMMPKGSNSGVYLQGRYEVQLFDSWGVPNPTFADAGGIYQRWDESRPKGREGFQGQAPRVNASRAPGLWQNLKIHFRAPRFDEQGNKVANARFVNVVHNGIVIHENVEVTGPTRAAAFGDEQPTGPLMLQGDHGPVAFRNIRFKRYSGERVRLKNLRYRAFHGEFADLATAVGGVPVREAVAEGISPAVAEAGDQFALLYEGTLSAPATGSYLFDLGLDWINTDPHFQGKVLGGARLAIGGEEVLLHNGMAPRATGQIRLNAGDHPFELAFYKNRPWSDNSGISLYVEGPGVERHELHDIAATAASVPEAITVAPGAAPVVLRSFVDYDSTVYTRAASVGDPAGVHYGYDLGQGALLYAWRGPFVETTQMWHDRGEQQTAEPLGSVLPISHSPPLAPLESASQPWPDSAGAEYRFGGYTLDEAGRPSFRYRIGNVDVEERIRPAQNGTTLQREIVLHAPDGTRGFYARVADAEQIRRLRDGSYAIGEPSYYVALERGTAKPIVRTQNGRQELLVPIRFRNGVAKLVYDIIW